MPKYPPNNVIILDKKESEKNDKEVALNLNISEEKPIEIQIEKEINRVEEVKEVEIEQVKEEVRVKKRRKVRKVRKSRDMVINEEKMEGDQGRMIERQEEKQEVEVKEKQEIELSERQENNVREKLKIELNKRQELQVKEKTKKMKEKKKEIVEVKLPEKEIKEVEEVETKEEIKEEIIEIKEEKAEDEEFDISPNINRDLILEKDSLEGTNSSGFGIFDIRGTPSTAKDNTTPKQIETEIEEPVVSKTKKTSNKIKSERKIKSPEVSKLPERPKSPLPLPDSHKDLISLPVSSPPAKPSTLNDYTPILHSNYDPQTSEKIK